VPKAFAPLGNRPMIAFALEAASRSSSVDAIVVVMPQGYRSDPAELEDLIGGFTARDVPLRVTVGGASRQESVRLGLAEAPLGLPEAPLGRRIVLVHDAARPFASPGLFDAGVAALLAAHDGDRPAGAVPGIPCPDTVKRVRDGAVVETVARDDLLLAQTPQAFDAEALRDAHRRAEAAGIQGTDDAMLLEAAGYQVVTFAGEPTNFKVTTPEDLERAEQMAASLTAREAPELMEP